MKQGGKDGENGPEKIVADTRGPAVSRSGFKIGRRHEARCVARILSVRSMQMGLAAGLKVVEERRGSRDESTRHEREIIPSSRGSHAIAGVLDDEEGGLFEAE